MTPGAHTHRKERTNDMTRFGSNMKWTASEELRDAMERFFTEGLGCQADDGPMPALRLYTFADGAHIGVYFVPAGEALGVQDMEKAPWIELCVDDIDAARQRLGAVGVAEFDYADKAHHYFKAPGGQVFRLAKAS